MDCCTEQNVSNQWGKQTVRASSLLILRKSVSSIYIAFLCRPLPCCVYCLRPCGIFIYLFASVDCKFEFDNIKAIVITYTTSRIFNLSTDDCPRNRVRGQ